jgi:glycopeptide antibiotics resistance protein
MITFFIIILIIALIMTVLSVRSKSWYTSETYTLWAVIFYVFTIVLFFVILNHSPAFIEWWKTH